MKKTKPSKRELSVSSYEVFDHSYSQFFKRLVAAQRSARKRSVGRHGVNIIHRINGATQKVWRYYGGKYQRHL